jgi:hypothetical protein
MPPFSYWQPVLQTFASSILLPTGGNPGFRDAHARRGGGFVFHNTAAPLGGLIYQEVAVVALTKQKRCRKRAPAWHARFLAMLPAIVTHARITFRHLGSESRAEAIQCVVASSFVAYARLVELGKETIAYPSVLARLGCAQYRAHRRVGGKLNIGDVLSGYCRAKKHVIVERLDHFDDEDNQWREAVVQDTRSAPVPDIVAFRCDFADWLRSLSRRDRRITLTLAGGEATGRTARKFGISAGRVSQIRRQLHEGWCEYQGETSALAAVPA